MSIESDVEEFLNEQIETLASGSPLFEVPVLPDMSTEIPNGARRVVRIGSCAARLSPNQGGTEMQNYDAVLPLTCQVRIPRGDAQRRAPHRDAAITMAETIALWAYEDDTLGDRVMNARGVRVPPGNDQTDAVNWATATLMLIVNETGEVNFDTRRGLQT